MSSKVWESTVVPAPVGTVWEALRTLDFGKLMPGLVATSTVIGGASQVGGQRKVTFMDGSTWLFRVVQLSDLDRKVTWELVSCKPSIKCSSRIDSLQLRRVTSSNGTFVEWDTDFSSDATLETTQDCKYKKTEALKNLVEWFSASPGDRIFAKLDANSDGFVSGAELKKMFGLLGLPTDVVTAFMVDADINMDGKLSPEEFATLLEKAKSIDMLPPLDAILAQIEVASSKVTRVSNQLFTLVDLDKSGTVSASEIATCCQKLGLDKDTATLMFVSADMDMNGDVSKKEFFSVLSQAVAADMLPPLDACVAQLEVVMTHVQQAADKIFAFIDTDHSGSLSVAEVKRVFGLVGLPDDQFTMFFSAADTNMDDSISKEEFMEILSKLIALDMLPPLDAMVAQLDAAGK